MQSSRCKHQDQAKKGDGSQHTQLEIEISKLRVEEVVINLIEQLDIFIDININGVMLFGK